MSKYATPTAKDAPVLATWLPMCSNGTRTSERRRMAASRHFWSFAVCAYRQAIGYDVLHIWLMNSLRQKFPPLVHGRPERS